MVPITQCPSPKTLRECAEHGAASEELHDLFGHLEQCSECTSKLEEFFADNPLLQALRSGTAVLPPENPALAGLIERLRNLRPAVAVAATNEETIAAMQPDTVSSSTPAAPEEPTEPAVDFLGAPQQAGEIGRLGVYRVLKQLGAGGMGMVFLAEDTLLHRKVALKTMLPAFAANTVAKDRFLREARAAAAVEHENVVAIYQVGEDRGVPYLAMTFLKGEALDERLKRERPLPIPEAVRIAAEMAEGLAAAHDTGLVHRDIKPGNVWLEGAKAKVKLLDFGLARAQLDDAKLTQTGAIVGTPAFMAPEQARNEKIDGRADLFSLGAVLYTMLTGNRPFLGENTLSVLTSLALVDPPTPKTMRPEVSAEISDLTMKLLAKDVAGRPESARAAAAALRKQLEVISDKTATFSPPLEKGIEDGTARSQAARPSATANISPSQGPKKIATTLPLARPRRSRLPFVAVGLLLLISGAFAAYQFAFKTPHGTFVVEINDKDVEARFKNGELQILDKDGIVKYTLKADERAKDAPPGEYRMRVVGADGLTVKSDVFTLKKGETTTVRVELAPVVVAKNDPPPQEEATIVGKAAAVTPTPYALRLDTNSSVKMSRLIVDFSRPCTMEGYVTRRDSNFGGFPFVCDGAAGVNVVGRMWNINFWADDRDGKHKNNQATGTIPVVVGKRTHLAQVYTGRQLRLYVDGKLSVQQELGELSLEKLKLPFMVGLGFTGEVGEVRVSTFARYEKDFIPQARFEADVNTVGLYHFEEGHGEVLKDSSGKLNHGQINGATWVKADGRPLNSPAHDAPSQFALRFESNGSAWSSVPIRSLVPDFSHPCTIEGFVTARDTKDRFKARYPFLCDGGAGVSANFGAKFGIWGAGSHADDPSGKHTSIDVPGTLRVSFGKRTHLALVSTGRQFRLYVDGVLSGQTDFGNMSIDKYKPHLTIGRDFNGEVSEVRVSKVARYDKEFTPQPRFEPDPDTLALYHFDEGQGVALYDSSGNGHHGKIDGATWVKVDGSLLPQSTPSQYALQFNYKDVVKMGQLIVDLTGPRTIEGYVTARETKKGGNNYPFPFVNTDSGMWTIVFWADDSAGKRKLTYARGKTPVSFGRRTHLAMVFGGRQFRLYVDGKLSVQQDLGELSVEKIKWSFDMGFEFTGEVSEVRVSKVARYDKDFIPQARFEADADTVGLYHFDEGHGEVLKDSSGKQNHGQINGATWVKADGRPLNSPPHDAPSQFALQFASNGSTWSSIPVGSLVPDFSQPCTMEGYVTAHREKGVNFAPFLCDGGAAISGQYGVWKAVAHADDPKGKWTLIEVPGTFRVAVGKRTHLALVSTGRQYRLYVDGLLSGQKDFGDLSVEKRQPHLTIGRDFTGAINEVRVSKVARYDKDFTPPLRFEPDADTLGLYHFDEGQGEVLYDSSGNGHHGKIIGAKWVKVAEVAALDAWLKQVATLPVNEQLEAIKAELVKRNPGFDGEIRSPRIDQAGVLEELHITTDNVTDIAPLQAFTSVKRLSLAGSGHLKGKLVDLSPLKGMTLPYLNCGYSKLSDLSSLKYVNLTNLSCRNSMVSDLSPLKNSKLTQLDCSSTPVADLSPLKDLKLTSLFCGGGTKVSDLSPLKGMPLTSLELGDTKVSDLSPLAGMPLTYLACQITKVSDLSPLKGMPLKKLVCHETKVTDLTPLRGMPLVELQCDFVPERDAEVLRSIKTLEKINGKPAAEFWMSIKEQPKN